MITLLEGINVQLTKPISRLLPILFLLALVSFGSATYLGADTIAWPVSLIVTSPPQPTGQLDSDPVSVAVGNSTVSGIVDAKPVSLVVTSPPQPTGEVNSGPVSVAIGNSTVSGEVTSKPISVIRPVTDSDTTHTSWPVSVAIQSAKLGDPDLVGLWHMDGDWFDSSGNNLNGNPNGASFSSDRKLGANSGSFNGSSYVAVGNLYGKFPDNTVSIESWVKLNDTGNGAHKTIAGGTGSWADYEIGIANNQFFAQVCAGTNICYPVFSGFTPVSGTSGPWYHIAGTFDGSVVKLYVNGVFMNSTPAVWRQVNGNVDFWMGGGSCCGYRLNGLVDEVAIYKRALANDEIAQHYASGISDPAAPSAPAIDPVPSFVGANNITLTGTRPAGTSIWVNSKKVAALDNSTTWQGSYATLQPGVNILNVTALDAVNRLSPPVSATVFYDNVPAAIASSTPANGSNTARPVTSVIINLYDANAGVDAIGSIRDATVKNAADQPIAGSWATSGTNAIIFTPAAPFSQDTYTVSVYPVDAVGNRATQAQTIVFTNHDTSQPNTTATLSGTKGSDGWYTTSVTVTLAAADGTDGSGVMKTEYSLDNVSWQLYSAPFVVDRDGKSIVYFKSTDTAGNIESPAKTKEITINKTGLVGLWHMDGDWQDASVVGNNGTPNGGVTFSANAKIGTQAGSFDGVNDYVQIPNMPTLNPSRISVELWAKSNVATWNSYGSMASKRDAYILHPMQGSKEIRFYGFIDGNWQHVSYNNPNLDITRWHHYVGTYDGVALNVYVDGVKSSMPYAGSINTADTGALYLGWDDGQNASYSFFNGLLDEVSIYNRVLTDIEVQQHYRDFVVASPTVNPVTSPTNFADITLSGTKPANTAIVVNGNTLVPLDGETFWRARYTLSAGQNNLSVTALDSQSFNSLPVTLSVALDDTPPQVPATMPQNSGILKAVPAAITFNLSDAFSQLDLVATLNGATVTSAGLSVGGTWSSTGTGTSGTVTFTSALPLTEGSYTATIYPADSLGNSTTSSITFTIDITPPPAPGVDPFPLPIKITSATVTGTKSTDAFRVMVTCPGASVGAVTYPTNATWSVNVSGLKEGGNSFSAYAEDTAGNPSGSVSTVITVDLTPPAKPTVAAFTSPIKETTVTLSGGKESDTWLFFNNQQIDAPFGGATWGRTVSLTEGSNSFTVYAKDAAGNQGPSASVAVVRDTTPPVLASSTPVVNAVTNTADGISVTFADTYAGADLAASLTGAVVKSAGGAVIAGSWSVSGSTLVFTPQVPIPEGVYVVTLYPVDTLGNKGSAAFSFTLDRTPPAVQSFALNPASPVKAGTVTFTLAFSEAMTTSIQPAVTFSRGLFSGTYTLTGFWIDARTWRGSYALTADTGDGTYSVTAGGAKDLAGNVMASQQAGTFVLVTALPATPAIGQTTTPTKVASQTLSGAKPADTALVINNAVRVPLNSATTWSYSYPLAEGPNSLTIVARDAAGNDSLPIAPAPVISLDTTPPQFTIDIFKSPSPAVTQTIGGKKEPGCIVKLNGTTIFDATDQSATWSYPLILTDGISNHLIFTAADSLGNITTKTLDILCDTAPPSSLAAGMLVADGSGKGTEVALSWPSYVETSGLGYYRIYSGVADYTSVAGLTPAGTVSKGTRSFKVSGLTQGTRYWFAVVPVSVSGNADPAVHTASAIPTDTVAPEEVTGLAAWAGYTAADGNYVTLSWVPSANTLGDLAEQLVYVDAGQGYDAGVSIGKTATTFTKKGLADATNYKFKVTTKDTLGHESAGTVVTAVTRLANPAGLAATPGNGKVTLTWNAVASPYVKLYNVYRLQSASPQMDVTTMTLVKSQNGLSYTDTGLVNGTTYQYAVTTLSSSGAERTDVQSVSAAPRGDTTGPVISGLNLTANQVITAPVTITASATDAESAMGRIEVYIDGVMASTQNGGTLSYAWNVVNTVDGNHTVRIAAYDAPGNLTEQIIPVVVSLAPPAAPVITTTFGGSVTATAVSISGTTQPGSTVTLRVNGVAVSSTVAASSGFTFTPVALLEGDNYIAAKASNRGGESPYSADLKVTVDTGAPQTPTALTAKLLAAGAIQLAWQAGSGEIPTGFNLYESLLPITTVNGVGVHRINSTPIAYLLKEQIPADDSLRFYAVTALDSAGNESPISNVVSIASDRLAPTAMAAFTAGTGSAPSDNTYGPGTIKIVLTVSEPLKELPFLSIEPQSGSPIVVALRKVDDTHYDGNLTIDAASPHGPTTWKFSGKDMAGNRGASQGSGPILDVRGPQVSITAPLTLLKSTAGPVAVTFTLDEASTIIPVMSLTSSGSSAPLIDLASADNMHWSGMLDPAGLAEGNGRFILDDARDRFNNRGANVTVGANIIIYKTTPPAPSVPMGLTAKSFKGGEVRLAWLPVTDARSYNLYRQGSGDATALKVATVTGSNTTTWSEAVTPDGSYSYSISSVGLLDSESAQSPQVTVVTDATPPPAPNTLMLTMTGNGVKGVWQAGAGEAAPYYRLYRSNGPISDITGLNPVATVKELVAFDASPDSSKRFYAVTSLDQIGNESAPSAAPEITFPVMPVRNLVVSRIDDGKPSLSWEAGEANLQGFYIYRNGSKVNQAPTTSTTFSDGYYSGGSITYGISAVNGLGTESPVREATLPEFSIGLKDGTLLRRGLLENVVLTASLPQGGTSPLTLDSVLLKIGSLPESSESGPFVIPVDKPLEIAKVAATEATAPPQTAVVVTAVMTPTPGVTVRLTRSVLAGVIASGSPLEIFNEPLVRGTQGKVRIKVTNTGSARMEFVSSINGGASAQARVILRDQDNNTLAQGSLFQRAGTQVVDSGAYATVRLEPGESFLSDPVTFGVPANAPYKVTLEAVIDATWFHYNQADQVMAPGMKASQDTTIADVSYTAVAQTDKAIYKQGEKVIITGTAVSTADGKPMANVPVKIVISVKGFDRFATVNADNSGNFSYIFTPGSNEAGSYSVGAIHPDLSDRTVQAQFSIIGLQISPLLANIRLLKGQSYDIPVNLVNLGGSPLTSLGFTTDASSGITATPVNAGNPILNPGESRTVIFRVGAGQNAPASGYASLDITTQEGLGNRVDASITTISAIPVIATTPSYIDTGLMRGNQRIENLTIRNTGAETLVNPRIEGPSLPWLALTVDRNIGDIPAGQSRTVGILIKPAETMTQGVYDDRIVIYSDNHIPYTYNIQVTVTSSAVGNVQFSVLNELMKDVAGASITFQNQSVLELIQTIKTDALGSATVFDLPEGRYSYNISAPGATPTSGSFVILPGTTTNVPIALELSLVKIEWSVTPVVIEDRYDIRITQTYETNVPTPVLVVEPAGINLPDLQPGQVFNGELTVSNYGLISLDNVKATFPSSIGDYDIELMSSSLPNRLDAMQKVVVPYRVTRRIAVSSNASSIGDEITGFGGGTCYSSKLLYTITGTAVICPSTPAEKTVEKKSDVYGNFPTTCPTGGGPVAGSTSWGTSGGTYAGSTGGGTTPGPGGAGIPVISALPTSSKEDFCSCKPDDVPCPGPDSAPASECQKYACKGGKCTLVNDDGKYCDDKKVCTSYTGTPGTLGPDKCKGGTCKGNNIPDRDLFDLGEELDVTQLIRLVKGAVESVQACRMSSPSVSGEIKINYNDTCCEESDIKRIGKVSGSVKGIFPLLECSMPIPPPYNLGLPLFLFGGIDGQVSISGGGVTKTCSAGCNWFTSGNSEININLGAKLAAAFGKFEVVSVKGAVGTTGSLQVSKTCNTDVELSGCIGPMHLSGEIAFVNASKKSLKVPIMKNKSCWPKSK